MLSSCTKQDIIYKKQYTEEEKKNLSETLFNGAGNNLYYQGSVGERMIINEGVKHNHHYAKGQRELGVPYLKRGFAAEAFQHYAKASKSDPEEWLGNKAYCWLYFYRDYELVLQEIEEYDPLTPGFVDYPQSTSVNYMRGISHFHLGHYDEAIHYLDLHLNKELADVGAPYIESVPYIALGLSYHNLGKYTYSRLYI